MIEKFRDVNGAVDLGLGYHHYVQLGAVTEFGDLRFLTLDTACIDYSYSDVVSGGMSKYATAGISIMAGIGRAGDIL